MLGDTPVWSRGREGRARVGAAFETGDAKERAGDGGVEY